MKKAIKINLGGLIFHIDEDAYDKLKEYLSALSDHFGNSAEAKEIIADIESRIAELFQSKINQKKQVICVSEVEDIINILGKPSDFDTESSQTTNEPYGPTSTNTARRNFYRDVDNSVLGGVCSGLGAYFDIDTVIFRIIFVLFTFIGGAAVPIYIILWIALPAARTAAQKLEMKGRAINISNIEKTVKQEFDQVKNNFKRIDAQRQIRDFFKEFIHVAGVIFIAILKVIGILIGVILTMIGIGLIIGLIVAVINHPLEFSSNNYHISNLSFLFQQFLSNGQIKITFIITALIIVIPILCLLYLGLKLIFRFKFSSRYFWLGCLATWITSAILFIIIAVSGLKHFSEEFTKTSKMKLDIKKYKILYLKINPAFSDDTDLRKFINKNDNINYYLSNGNSILGRPGLIIKSTYNNDESTLNIKHSSRGLNYENAVYNANRIIFNSVQKDSLLIIDPYFVIAKENKWRFQQVELNLTLPIGTVINIDNKFEPILRETENSDNAWYKNLSGKTWVITAEGFASYDKEKEQK